MKNITILIALLSFSSFSMGAEDGTGQGRSQDSSNSQLFEYCNIIIKAEDGTGQGKAEDGTGQGKAEDGTGQYETSSAIVGFCQQYLTGK